LVLNSNFLK